ncbi:MAG: hydantoinase B/oxoprolinase family protein [Alphaproteobacteria bacterium]|nr:hydantoinase B/oxoprolinase family protein [Alphaproteobacteria bacterium]
MGALFDHHVRLTAGLTYDRDAYGRGPGVDPDLICHGLEPVTALEAEGIGRVNDLDVELLHHKLTAIVEEARDVYMALSITESVITGDMNCGLFTASGDPVAVATGIYFHTMLNNAQLKYVNKYYRPNPTVGLRDGDIYFFNDETAGGVHAFDMFTAAPVFFGEELVGWVSCGGHQGDSGSPTPGGFNSKARSRYEEGLHIQMMRIGSDWLLNQDVLDMMTGSVRNPFVFAADLRSRVATLKLIRDRLMREVERRGVHMVVGGMRRILMRAEIEARARIAELNDGIFRAVMFNDDDLGGALGLTRIPVTMIKEGDGLTILVQGVSPENKVGPMHGTWHLVRAASAVYLFSYFYRGLKPNAGLLQPIRYLVEGPSIANSSYDVAHGMGTSIAACVVNGAHVLGSKLLFDSAYREAVQAPHSRNQNVFVFSGENRRGYMAANFSGATNAAGQGARFDSDGESAIGFFWGPFTDSGETEETDTRLPHFVLDRRIDRNYHGYGRYRGGAPLVEVSTACGHLGCVLSSWGSADKLSHNPGLMGGYYGPPNPRIIIKRSDFFARIAEGEDVDLSYYALLTEQKLAGTYRIEPSGQRAEKFEEGDLMIFSMGGGGGYGDVLEREPEAVVRDLRDGMITEAVARDIYRVLIDPETGLVDRAATERARAALRRERRRKGKPFDAFMRAWSKRKPPDEVVRYYGAWPEPRSPGYSKPFWGLHATG